jgi:hypothetical protein
MQGRAVLAVLAAWAIAVPWIARAVGQTLDVSTRLEVIDHVVPGVAVLVCCVLMGTRDELLRLGLAGVAFLAGLWITATHVTLIPEAVDGVTPWGAALLHLSAGLPVALLALWLLVADSRR